MELVEQQLPVLESELDIISHLDSKCVIIDIESNDVCNSNQDIYEMAKSLLKLSREVVGKYGVCVSC